MTSTQANGITIEYELVGDRANPPILMVMGFGGQLVYWPPGFIEAVADRDFMVVIYDNRDVGLSTKFEQPGYSLDDMADDGMALLDALDIGSAHIVGASMGGYIVQRMAIRFPSRIRSLCSIMSTTGDASLPGPSPEVAAGLVQAEGASREEVIEQGVAYARLIGSPGYPLDEAWVRERNALQYDRCYHPAGRLGHGVAVASATDHTEQLRALDVPTLVIHGDADPLVHPLGGKATAAAIPGARLMMVPGMGHDLPREVWPDVVDAITANIARS